MKFNTITGRIAATGAVSALAAAGLVGLTTTSASAAVDNQQYTCQGTSEFPVWLTSSIPAAEAFPSAPAGMDVAAGLLGDPGVLNTVTVPDEVLTTMQQFGITRLESPDFAGSIGSTIVAATGVGADVADAQDNGNGTHSFEADGTNAAFEMPKAGDYQVLSPAAFTIAAKNSSGATVLSVPCTLTDAAAGPAAYQSIAVVKNDSTTSGHAKAVRKGKVSTVKITVAAANQTPTGKVVVKKGTKTLGKVKLNKNGVATFKQKFKKTTKLSAFYKGDGYTNKSSTDKPIKVVVKR